MSAPASASASVTQSLLAVEDIKVHFPVRRGLAGRKGPKVVRAVDGVSLSVAGNRTVAIVGESGSGKTTLARVILRLVRPTSGRVSFQGQDVTSEATWRRGSPVQAVFQDPRSSLNPRMRIEDIVSEPLSIAGGTSREERRNRVAALLDIVGIESAAGRRFPHEFSGGQRQRIAIARALAPQPKLIVLDEPLSALDVSIRAQIINLLLDIQEKFQCSYLMIAHDLASVRVLSHDVAVMYRGRIVEFAPVGQVFTEPRHPYTQALLSASLPLRPGGVTERIRLKGDVTSSADPPSGCPFRARCVVAFDRCAVEDPAFTEVTPGHYAACHRAVPDGSDYGAELR